MPRNQQCELRARHQEIERQLAEYALGDGRIAIVQAPPGSGKTTLLLQLSAKGVRRKLRLAIGTQTNSQADDVCRRLVRDFGIPPVRFAGAGGAGDLPGSVRVVTSAKDLPSGSGVVVGTVAKWTFNDIIDPYDLLIIDEAWQMPWAAFMPCNAIAARFVLIGDPGQIAPVVTIDTSRWETSPRPPHRPAPDLILAHPPRGLLKLSLPGSRRLPKDSVDLVREFYDFNFDAWARPEDRRFTAKRTGRLPVDRVIDRISTGSGVVCTIPTPDCGPPLELDEEIGKVAVSLAERLVQRSAEFELSDDSRQKGAEKLRPEHIGLCATHRIMNTYIQLNLPKGLQAKAHVDTPERWQGLERPIMIFVHPLSGVTQPSAFDLDTGRLCVMASRHKIAFIVVARDHVPDTLEDYICSADQAVGCDDTTGRGLDRHLRFWRGLSDGGRVVAL